MLVKIVNVSGHLVEVYVNPKSQEFDYTGDDIRFTADSLLKKVYVWNAYYMNHDKAADELMLPDFIWFANNHKDIITRVRYFNGFAYKEKEGIKFVASGSDTLYCSLDYIKRKGVSSGQDYAYVSSILEQEWEWVNKWINMNSLVKKCKKKLNIIENINL